MLIAPLLLYALLLAALPMRSLQQLAGMGGGGGGGGGGGMGGPGLHHAMPVHHAAQRQGISNRTIGGDVIIGCKHTATVQTTAMASFSMCVGQTDQDLKNGMSIINVIRARGFLPTCRVLQLLLWMSSEVHENKVLPRESFIDVGANIGSCSVSIASLGFPVVSAEPVLEHVNMIKGTLALNPSFHIEVNHIGICVADRKIKVNFGHGARNWGATYVDEQAHNSTSFETELRLKTLDQVIGHRKVSLLKVDCEGCEWAALKSARRTLKRVPMIKIELVQPEYTAGNETVKANHILQFLNQAGFDLFMDVWAENHLYFGKKSDEILDIDRLFGSKKFNLGADPAALELAAKRVLQAPIDVATFNQKKFMNAATDVIAIERTLAEKMRLRWLPWKQR